MHDDGIVWFLLEKVGWKGESFWVFGKFLSSWFCKQIYQNYRKWIKYYLFLVRHGNGGTQTWTRQILDKYKSQDFKLVHVDLSTRRGLLAEASILKRIIDGLLDFKRSLFRC